MILIRSFVLRGETGRIVTVKLEPRACVVVTFPNESSLHQPLLSYRGCRRMKGICDESIWKPDDSKEESTCTLVVGKYAWVPPLSGGPLALIRTSSFFRPQPRPVLIYREKRISKAHKLYAIATSF